eukprot:Skav225150  [mRNA]  locus=scaffold1056:264347:269649:- [translate_table: standard]
MQPRCFRLLPVKVSKSGMQGMEQERFCSDGRAGKIEVSLSIAGHGRTEGCGLAQDGADGLVRGLKTAGVSCCEADPTDPTNYSRDLNSEPSAESWLSFVSMSTSPQAGVAGGLVTAVLSSKHRESVPLDHMHGLSSRSSFQGRRTCARGKAETQGMTCNHFTLMTLVLCIAYLFLFLGGAGVIGGAAMVVGGVGCGVAQAQSPVEAVKKRFGIKSLVAGFSSQLYLLVQLGSGGGQVADTEYYDLLQVQQGQKRQKGTGVYGSKSASHWPVDIRRLIFGKKDESQ